MEQIVATKTSVWEAFELGIDIALGTATAIVPFALLMPQWVVVGE